MIKNVVAGLSAAVLMAACGNSADTKAPENKDSVSTSSATTPSTSTASSDKGLELIGASDCTTCHRLTKESGGAQIGPAYSEVAAKYSPAADTTVSRLVKKVITGGSGIWGTVPMTPHPALKEEDVKTMVTYILTLKK